MYWASFCQDGWSLCYFYAIFLLLWATHGVWDFFSMLSGLTAAKECHAGLPFLIAWPMQRPSLSCSLSATKPLLPLCSSPGNSALVKEEGILFPHVFPLENLSTLFLSMTPFPHNPNEMSSLPSSSSLRESHRQFGHSAPSLPRPPLKHWPQNQLSTWRDVEQISAMLSFLRNLFLNNFDMRFVMIYFFYFKSKSM